MAAKALRKIRDLSLAQVAIRKSLKDNEENNKKIRASITKLWDDRSKDEEVSVLAKKLIVGRAKVRAYQYALRDLKLGKRHWNKCYDTNAETE